MKVRYQSQKLNLVRINLSGLIAETSCFIGGRAGSKMSDRSSVHWSVHLM